MNAEYITYEPEALFPWSLKRTEFFAWVPVKLGILFEDRNGIKWLKQTNKRAWLRKVVKCEGLFETWYELPKEEKV